jgi:hypothetical protein
MGQLSFFRRGQAAYSLSNRSARGDCRLGSVGGSWRRHGGCRIEYLRCRIEPGSRGLLVNCMPDGTTLWLFRGKLAQAGLIEKISKRRARAHAAGRRALCL